MENKLWQALDHLREHGWCKYKLHDEEGRVCARGALSAVGWTEEDDNRIGAVASELFPDRIGHDPRYNSYHPVPAFNNHPDTVFEDVEMVLEKAAIRADEILG